MEGEGERSRDELRVLLFPWLAHGHLSPYLELGKRLSCRGFRVYLCSTAASLASFRNNDDDDVELVELILPELPGLAADLHTTKNMPPHLMPQLKAALDLSEPQLCSVLDSLRPGLLIYDIFQPWAAAAAMRHGIPAVLFLTASSGVLSLFGHAAAKPGEKFPLGRMRSEDGDYDGEEEVAYGRRFVASLTDRASGAIRLAESSEMSCSFVLIRTSAEIEGRYVEYLSTLRKKEHVPVGTLVGEPRLLNQNDHGISAWLAERPPSSVAFVSLGSEFFAGKEAMAQIARGLELSGVDFIWVVRFPKGEEMKLEEALPEGFLERNSDKGMVAQGWLPQDQILAHATVGAFVSHCGWGSVLEALRRGVPLVAMPQQFDQPLNAKFVARLGVGVNVRRQPSAEELARALQGALFGKESENLRKRSREIAEMLRQTDDVEVEIAAARLAQLIHNGVCSTPRTT